jgi:vacuolar-type H+-ATPase subunit I/STV1
MNNENPVQNIEQPQDEIPTQPEIRKLGRPKGKSPRKYEAFYKGRTLCLSIKEWSRETGIKCGTIVSRMSRNVPIDKVFETVEPFTTYEPSLLEKPVLVTETKRMFDNLLLKLSKKLEVARQDFEEKKNIVTAEWDREYSRIRDLKERLDTQLQAAKRNRDLSLYSSKEKAKYDLVKKELENLEKFIKTYKAKQEIETVPNEQ